MRPQGPLIARAALAAPLGIIIATHTAWAAAGGARMPDFIESLATFETAAGVEAEDLQPKGPSRSTNLVRRIQEGLADQGFYLGPIDGRYGPQTEAAIKAYQRSADLKIDGKATDQLARDLETGGQIGQLLGRLEKSRQKSTEAAREALLNNPETRYLIEGAAAAQGAPHDSKACMAKPEPRCLLVEATTSARDIDKPEMRDWALGEILTAQARAGLAQDAAITTRRIHDPRLIMVALRDIAKARAEIGEIEDAMAAVDIIPDPVQQVEAYVAIAEVQAKGDAPRTAVETAKHLTQYLVKIPSNLTRVSFRTRVAVILYKAGQEQDALDHITAAEQLLFTITDSESLDKAHRHIAAAYAENGMAERALEVLAKVENGGDDVPVLVAAATGQAQAGAAEAALITADSIEAVRYRALVLARIASYQAGAGLFEEAQDTLKKAKLGAAKIRFPFAKAYAFSRIALAYNDVGISMSDDGDLLEKALEAAHLIKDDRLRAHIFWTIADERRRGGDVPGATRAQEQASNATDDILSPFSRVWMLCDIAMERAKRQENDAAWSVFNLALDEAKTIKNPWGRARALSKVAATMTSLADKTAATAKRL